ncbi:RNA polymerase sigma factor [Solirubrum puertoriconensis]|uniref:RNA polymerase subunit sigma-24 n=1 Tax=Solirubrum puertoriconensis TaxID=1751427 RepID=A0A9X0L5B8_SOLP1|nr:RNA polymerase sigma factor [Solirubrum puertoriconensis]KUG08523.1 hypothetical protein ASU33_10195 [Solirubrum puertoriconensis]
MPLVAPPDFVDTIAQYRPMLWRVCRLYCPASPDDQRDLYQEMVLQLWQAWPQYQGRAKLSTWLYRIALNVAISALRREQRRPASSGLDDAAQELASPGASGPEADELEQLYAAIERLSDVDKALVLLRLEERPDDEIADILGITVNNVRVKMHRALQRLRQLLPPQ